MSKGSPENVERLIKQAMRDLWKENKALTTQAVLDKAIAKVAASQGEIVLDSVARARLINAMIRERSAVPPPITVQPEHKTETDVPLVPPRAKPSILTQAVDAQASRTNLPPVKAVTPRARIVQPLAKSPMLPLQKSQELERKRKELERNSPPLAQASVAGTVKKESNRSLPQVSALVIAENVAKNSPAWLICENKPAAGQGAKKIQVVRALADFVIDRFTMDLTKGQSYAYKSGEIQGLTAVSGSPALFASMAPDQYLLPEPELLDVKTIEELVALGVKIHLQAEIDLAVEKVVDSRIEAQLSPLLYDESLIKANLNAMGLKDNAEARAQVSKKIKEGIKAGASEEIKEKFRREIKNEQNLMERFRREAEDTLSKRLREKLRSVKLKEITYDIQVETILKDGKVLSRNDVLYISTILQAWMGSKHVIKVADKVAGANKPYAVLSITGAGQSEIKGFGIRDNTEPKFRSSGVVEYERGVVTRPSIAVYMGHHPRIRTQLTIQSGGKLNGVEGKLNIQASSDLTALVSFYRTTMGARPPIPVVVNCTDGIDRTGMVMTALMILDKFNKGDDITTKLGPDQEAALLNLIEDLRKDRGPFFLRGTTDIPIAITLGYALIATQKQQIFQDGLRALQDNHPAVTQLLDQARSIDMEGLKTQLLALQKRQDIPSAQQENITMWLALVEKGIEAYKQFNTANDTKADYRKKFNAIQRDSDSDGIEAKDRKYPTRKEVEQLATRGFKPALLNEIKPIMPSENRLLERIYNKNALYVYNLSDLAEDNFERYCHKELGVQDEDQILAAKMLLIADIMLDRHPRDESESLSEYEKHLISLIKKAEQRPAGNIANLTAKNKNLQDAIIRVHGHALKEAAGKIQSNVRDFNKILEVFKRNKVEIMKNNPKITESVYEVYRQKIENAVSFYQKKIDALSLNDRKLLEILAAHDKTITFDEYKRAVTMLTDLLAYNSEDVAMLADMMGIYHSLWIVDAFASSEQLPNPLTETEFGKLLKAPTNSQLLFDELKKDLKKVSAVFSSTLNESLQTLDLSNTQTISTFAYVNSRVGRAFPIDIQTATNITILAELLKKRGKLNSKDTQYLVDYAKAMEAFLEASNKDYLSPTQESKNTLEKARVQLGLTYAHVENRKNEISTLLDKDKKFEEKFLEKTGMERSSFGNFTQLLGKSLETCKGAFTNIMPVVMPEPTKTTIPTAVSQARVSPASVSPELPRHPMPGPQIAKSKALMAEMQQKLSGRAAPMTPLRSVAATGEAGAPAQKGTASPPQSKSPRKTPPKGSL